MGPFRMKIGRLRSLKFVILTFLAVTVPLYLKSVLQNPAEVDPDEALPIELRSKEEYLAQNSQLPILHNDDTGAFNAFNTSRVGADQNSSSDDAELAKNEDDPPISATKVLLVTYYRGGSSFLGELFGNNPEAFYVFEPLYGVKMDKVEHKRLTSSGVGSVIDGMHIMLNNQTLRPLPSEYIERRYEQLRQLYQCQLSSMNNKIVNSVMFRSATHMPHFKPYRACLSMNRTDKSHCPRLLDDTCRDRSLLAVKTIRIPMYGIPEILEKVPDLKVIHYIRDPRGMLLSRQRWEKNIRGKAVRGKAKELCLQMMENLQKFHELKHLNSDKYLLVKYEDLALEPEKVTRDIYKFVSRGKPPPKEVLRWLDINTKQNAKDVFSTRRNSTETAYSWRNKWSQHEIDDMNEACKDELAIMGYSL